MTTIVQSAIEGLLDLVYPPRCLVCNTFGAPYLCPDCIALIEKIPLPYCRRCGQPVREDGCRNCSGLPRSFTTARAVGLYSGVLRQAVHEFKYSGCTMLADPLADLMHSYLTESADFPWSKADCIIPVPMHAARYRVRGYNQSELLGRALGKKLDMSAVVDALERVAPTRPQVSLPGEQRRRNLKNAFRIVERMAVRGQTILLVDDVATTCSTLHECGRALLDAGARRIYALCIAFGA